MPTLPTGERMPSGGVFPLISAVRARRAPSAVRRRQAPEHRLITPDPGGALWLSVWPVTSGGCTCRTPFFLTTAASTIFF